MCSSQMLAQNCLHSSWNNIICGNCGSVGKFTINSEGFEVCCECGFFLEGGGFPVLDPKYEQKHYTSGGESQSPILCDGESGYSKRCRPFDNDGNPIERPWLPKSLGKFFINKGCDTKGRYKPVFHWNERLAQLGFLLDPVIPKDVVERIRKEARSGKYGPCGNFTYSTVTMILRSLKLVKYRERSKTILSLIKPNVRTITLNEPMGLVLERINAVYKGLEGGFCLFKDSMPKSLIRSKNGVNEKDRHNILPFNYLFRKICEGLDPPIRDFHEELPLLRSAPKLHNLDDIMKQIAYYLGLKFERTAVIKRPKIKKKK